MTKEEYESLICDIQSELSPIIKKYKKYPVPLKDSLLWIIEELENQ